MVYAGTQLRRPKQGSRKRQLNISGDGVLGNGQLEMEA